MNWKSKHLHKIVPHCLFWVVLWLFYLFFFSYNSNNATTVLTFASALIPITAIPAYIMVKVLIPNYLSKKKYVWFGVYSFYLFLFTTFCILMVLFINIAYVDNIRFDDLPPLGRSYAYLTILVLLVVTLLSFASIWEKSAKIASENVQLQNQLLTAQFKSKEIELSYLKNQIQPHFLFNTLNTIYGMALKNSAETPDIILKLSDLLDYVLYKADKPSVPLKDEIAHLEQYIELERIRFHDTLNVNFTKNIENQDLPIEPLLLLPFLENAFKHGSIIDDFLTVNIDISTSENTLCFMMENTFKKPYSTKGIGLKNVEERLQILYPHNHELQIHTDSNWFKVKLKIDHLKQKRYGQD